MEPCCTLTYYLSSRSPEYNVRVTWLFERRAVQIAAAAMLCILLILLILWIFPKPHRPLEYMIAGTAGTIVWLGLVLAILLRNSRTAVRIVRRGESAE
jgi:hypothetical protein